MKETRTRRVFRCSVDGWRSSSFGYGNMIDLNLMDIAKKELEKHMQEAHGCGLYDDAGPKVEVVIEKREASP